METSERLTQLGEMLSGLPSLTQTAWRKLHVDHEISRLFMVVDGTFEAQRRGAQ